MHSDSKGTSFSVSISLPFAEPGRHMKLPGSIDNKSTLIQSCAQFFSRNISSNPILMLSQLYTWVFSDTRYSEDNGLSTCFINTFNFMCVILSATTFVPADTKY